MDALVPIILTIIALLGGAIGLAAIVAPAQIHYGLKTGSDIGGDALKAGRRGFLDGVDRSNLFFEKIPVNHDDNANNMSPFLCGGVTGCSGSGLCVGCPWYGLHDDTYDIHHGADGSLHSLGDPWPD